MASICLRPEAASSRRSTPSIALFQNRIEGRFRKITVHQLCMAWWLYQSAHITRRQLRVYFAAHEMAERRRYAKNSSNPRVKKPSKTAYYGIEEVKTLIGGKGSTRADTDLQGDIRALCRIGLLQFSDHALTFARDIADLQISNTDGFQKMLDAMPHPTRSIAVPRRTLRALAAGFSRGVTAVMLALMIRSLFWKRDQKEFRIDGRTKLSWIAETFGISRRAATEAHRHLVDLGWIVPQTIAHWERNRWGLRDQINPDWKAEEQNQEEGRGTSKPNDPVDNVVPSANDNIESASRYAQSYGDSASLLNSKPSYEDSLKTNNLEETPNQAFGNLKISESKEQSFQRSNEAPQLRNIRDEDLRDTSRLLVLYEQAILQGMVPDSEAGMLDFVSLAERALGRGHNPPAMFMYLIREWKTVFITQSDEDRARQRIREHRYGGNTKRNSERHSNKQDRFDYTEEEQFVVKCLQVAKQCRGIEPFQVARQLKGWTSDEWERHHGSYEVKDQRHWLRVGGYFEENMSLDNEKSLLSNVGLHV